MTETKGERDNCQSPRCLAWHMCNTNKRWCFKFPKMIEILCTNQGKTSNSENKTENQLLDFDLWVKLKPALTT